MNYKRSLLYDVIEDGVYPDNDETTLGDNNMHVCEFDEFGNEVNIGLEDTSMTV